MESIAALLAAPPPFSSISTMSITFLKITFSAEESYRTARAYISVIMRYLIAYSNLEVLVNHFLAEKWYILEE